MKKEDGEAVGGNIPKTRQNRGQGKRIKMTGKRSKGVEKLVGG